jgi:hypothetical protein
MRETQKANQILAQRQTESMHSTWNSKLPRMLDWGKLGYSQHRTARTQQACKTCFPHSHRIILLFDGLFCFGNVKIVCIRDGSSRRSSRGICIHALPCPASCSHLLRVHHYGCEEKVRSDGRSDRSSFLLESRQGIMSWIWWGHRVSSRTWMRSPHSDLMWQRSMSSSHPELLVIQVNICCSSRPTATGGSFTKEKMF